MQCRGCRRRCRDRCPRFLWRTVNEIFFQSAYRDAINNLSTIPSYGNIGESENNRNFDNLSTLLRFTDGSSAYGYDTDDQEIIYPENEIYDIFHRVFSQSELIPLQDQWISIDMTVSPEGEIWEISFSMRAEKRLMELPLERFAALEKEWKNPNSK